jgi:hypothetical protein
MPDATWPAIISAFASALSAAAAAFGNLRASREMKRWRDQRRESKRADVAAEVLVSTLRFLTTLSSLTSTIVTSSGQKDDSGLPVEVARRYDAAASAAGDFIKAWELAETYLPDEVALLLERAWDARAEIMSSQITYFSMPPPHGAEAHKRGFGAVPDQQLDALRAEARRLLRPLAQHADDATSKRAGAERQLEDVKRSRLSPGE